MQVYVSVFVCFVCVCASHLLFKIIYYYRVVDLLFYNVLFVNLSQIVAPYGGQLKKTGPREVTIAVNDMKSVMATISNVDLNVGEKEASLPNSDSLICLSLSRKLNPISHQGYNVMGK